MRSLLQSISADPQLKHSKDSILLAEDQYPESLDAIFTRLTTPTTLQNTMHLLQWNRKKESTAYDAELRTSTIINQDYLRNIPVSTHIRQSVGHEHISTMEVLYHQLVPICGTGHPKSKRQFQESTVPLFTGQVRWNHKRRQEIQNQRSRVTTVSPHTVIIPMAGTRRLG